MPDHPAEPPDRPVPQCEQELTPRADPLILPYSTVSSPSGIPVALRLLGLTFCLLGVLLGAVFIWFGAWGLHFAATESPARDRPGDYFAAGLITAIGVIVAGFSARWGWLAFRWLRQRSFGRYSETPVRQTGDRLR